LQQNQNQHDVGDDVLDLVGQGESGLGGVQRNGREQELPGIADQIGNQPNRQPVARARILLVVSGRELPQDPQTRPYGNADDGRHQPIRDRIAEKESVHRRDFM
jgi:hypothetical protein